MLEEGISFEACNEHGVGCGGREGKIVDYCRWCKAAPASNKC